MDKANPAEITVNIVNFIPYGRANAITGKELAKLLNTTPRDIRNRISKARRDTIILNLQDGKGYFRPIDYEEDNLVVRFLRQEERRNKTHNETLVPVRKHCYLRGIE